MQLKINTWAWTSRSLGCCNSTTITTVGTPTGTPGAQVQMSELIAMDDTGAEVTKVRTAEQPRVTTRPARHGGHHTVEHRRPQCGGLAGRVLLTPTPHGGCATPAVSARNETPDAPGRPAAPRQGPDARPGRRSPLRMHRHHPEGISRRRPRWVLSDHRNSPDKPRVCARHMCGRRYAHPVSCPYASGAYARAVPAGHMRLLYWRLARSVRACHCPTRPNLGSDAQNSRPTTLDR
jgi:hypothetical protein